MSKVQIAKQVELVKTNDIMNETILITILKFMIKMVNI